MENKHFEKISILTPTYNRNKFLKFYINNIKKQQYPHNLLDVIIDDDGTEPFIKDLKEVEKELHPIKITYLRNKQKRSIGQKRNNLVKNSKNKYFIFFDDDDLYNPICILYCYTMLKNNKWGICGTNQMIFCHVKDNFKCSAIQCKEKRQIHESGLFFTKKYFRSQGGFKTKGVGEGTTMIDGHNEKDVGLLECKNMLVCINHGENTVCKDVFNKEKNIIKVEFDDETKQLITDTFL